MAVGDTSSVPPDQTKAPEAVDVWIPFVEPVPDWEEATRQWGMWWNIHIYFVGIAFFMIAIYTVVSLVILIRYPNLRQRPYFIALNVIVFIFSFERGLFMFVDAYNAKGTLPNIVAYLFLSLGLPCMSSAFYLIFQAYLKVTKVRAVGQIHRTRTLVIIVVSHFLVSIALDVAAGYTLLAVYLLIACQAVFIVWAYTLSFMFFYLFRRIYKATVTSRLYLMRMSGISNHSDTSQKGQKKHGTLTKSHSANAPINRPRVILGAKLSLAIAILLFIIATLYLGGIFGCYTIQILAGKSPEPWPWWGYEFSVRICEIALCFMICLAATQPVNKRFASSMRKSRTWSSDRGTSSFDSGRHSRTS